MSICFLSGLVELLGISRVPILISALMPPPPHPSTPHHAFRHSSAGRYSSARWSTLKWWMENVKHCTRLLLPLSYDVDWHHEDLSLFETLSYLPFSSSSPSTSTHPSPRSFLYIYAGTFFLKKKIVTTNTWKDAAVVSLWTSRCGVGEGNFFFLFKK